jgi:hypothetical protein
MSRYWRIAVVLLPALLLWLWAGRLQAAPPVPVGATVPRTGSVRVEIDATRGDGLLAVHLALRDLPPRERFYLKRAAPTDEIEIRELSVRSAGGAALALLDDRDRWKIEGLAAGSEPIDLDVRYLVKVGGLGRHGHQGFVGEDWATFDGRVVLAPPGVQQLAELRVHYVVPEGWKVVTPFRPDGEDYLMDAFGPAAWEALSTACVGLGRFEVTERTVGKTPLGIAIYEGWGDETRAELVRGVEVMAAYFHDKLGFDPGRPFNIVFTPSGPEDKPVFGGAWSTGACYERPRDGARNWELLGHRFAHPMNKDLPDGLAMRDARDAWFTEGWASYIEVVATEQTGLSGKDRGFSRLYNGYLRGMLNHPHWRVPLASEPHQEGELKEFQHYTAGPLVVKALDFTLRQRSGKDMEGFMKELFAKYRGFSPPVPLREELERYAGVPLDDFFALYVDAPLSIGPVWEEWLSRAEAESNGPVIASVGTMPLSEGYLHLLLREGGFDNLAQVEEFLVRVAARERELAERGVQLWPQALGDRGAAIGPTARLEMDRALLAYPMDLGPPPRSRACGGASRAEPGSLQLDFSTEGGKLLHEMQMAEERYQAARGMELKSIQLKWGTRDDRGGDEFPYSLAVRAQDPLFVMMGWNDTLTDASLEVLAGKDVVQTKEILIEPGWRNTWSTLRAKDLGDARGLLTLRVKAGERVLAERAFWRR